MRVLITGAAGLVGTWLLRKAPPDIDAVAGVHTSDLDWPDRVRGDLRDPRQAHEALKAARPDLVVHAAYQRDRSSIVEATGNILVAAQAAGARVALLSTDAVFSGDGRPRAEGDIPDPVWDYGHWKAQAERMVAKSAATAMIVRLPLLVSLDPADGTSKQVQEAAARREALGWHIGERRQPAYASEVAAALWKAFQVPEHVARGVWHLPGTERLTRREIGARVAAALGVADPGVEVPAPPSPRPHDLQLTGSRAREHLGWRPSPVLADIE